MNFLKNATKLNRTITITLSHNVCPTMVRLNSNSASCKPKMKGIFKVGLLGITAGAIVGTGYSIHQQNNPKDHLINEQCFIEPVAEFPDVKPSRQINFQNDHSGLQLTLFQYQTCPFCCKVRAFLDYYGISYDVVEVDPVLRQSIKWSQYRKVPILVAKIEDGYQPLNDSTMIVTALASYFKDPGQKLQDIVKYFPFISYYDDMGVKKNEIMNRYFLMLNNQTVNKEDENILSEERKWRKWADNVLVHTLSPNVYRSREEALQAFNWFSEVGEWEKNFPSWERFLIIYVGAGAMYLIGKRLQKRHNLKEDVRESLYDECTKWVREVNKKGSPFMGGDRPNLADLSVYGILNSIEGCSAFKDLLDHTSIGKWYFKMKDAVDQHKGADLV